MLSKLKEIPLFNTQRCLIEVWHREGFQEEARCLTMGDAVMLFAVVVFVEVGKACFPTLPRARANGRAL